MVSIKRKIPIWAVLMIALVAVAGSAAALAIVNVDNNPLNPGSGSIEGSTDMTLKSQSLVYSGTNVTGTDVVVNNTGVEHTGNIQVVLEDSAGNPLETKEMTGVIFAASSDTTTRVEFASEHSMADVSSIDVVVEQTA